MQPDWDMFHVSLFHILFLCFLFKHYLSDNITNCNLIGTLSEHAPYGRVPHGS